MTGCCFGVPTPLSLWALLCVRVVALGVDATLLSHPVAPVLQGLLFYGSTAVFVSVYRGDQGGTRSDINFVPRALAMERLLKGVLTAVFVLLRDQVRRCVSSLLLVLPPCTHCVYSLCVPVGMQGSYAVPWLCW